MQRLIPPDDHVVVIVLHYGLLIGLKAQGVALVKYLSEELMRVLSSILEATLQKFFHEHIINVEEVVCVFAGISEHLFRDGALTPIR